MKNAQKAKKKTASAPKTNKAAIIVVAVIIVSFIFYMVYSNMNTGRNSGQEQQAATSGNMFTKQGEISFVGPDSAFKTRIDVEIADTEYKRDLGLMYRDKMEENQGMLFIFPQEDNLSFWMKNTILPLDMMFVDKNYKILNIHKNTKPYSLQSYSSIAPAQYVVEVNAGFTDAHNIEPGDQIRWRASN